MNSPMHMRRSCALVAGLLAAAALAGCGHAARRTLMNPAGLDRGLVIVVTGIDGQAAHNEAACRALCDDRLGMAVELYDWTAPLGPLFNQCAVGRNRQMARGLAERVGRYCRAHPGGRVYLVAHSAGTAVAVWALEALPEAAVVSGVVLLASSLSPGYDLAKALTHSHDGIVSFCSQADSVLLGAGTSWVGTADRKFTEAAGKVGFRVDPTGTAAGAYRKLHQVAWSRETAGTWRDGGHFACTAPPFVRQRVAPLIRGAAELAAATDAGRPEYPEMRNDE